MRKRERERGKEREREREEGSRGRGLTDCLHFALGQRLGELKAARTVKVSATREGNVSLTC